MQLVKPYVSDPMMALSLTVIIVWLVLIAGANLFAPSDPTAQNLAQRLQSPSVQHLMGTDQLGRDIFSRVLYGGRTSVPAALALVLMGSVIGTAIGAGAGFAGGVVDMVTMRVIDMVLAFPGIILAMAVSAALGPGLITGVIALAAVWWPAYARVCRGLVIQLKTKDYVVASRAAGRRPLAILLRVIMPNAIPPLFVMAGIDVGRGILYFAVLSFLGLGASPPQPEWGSMASSGAIVIDEWWVALFPSLAILSLVFAFNVAGDSIRDSLDPWLHGRR